MQELGLGERCDKLSHHPYRARPEASYRQDITDLRTMVTRSKPGMAIWQGENGVPSVGHATGNGYAMHVYWYPSDLQNQFDDAQCKLTVGSGKAAKLNHPVLVNLLTGVITPLSASGINNENNCF